MPQTAGNGRCWISPISEAFWKKEPSVELVKMELGAEKVYTGCA